ncbi:MAG: tetratricopeptide repeat protein [Planctomycetes bacterium]|nr:tetratricopeptide repeat protein [Planctomycetota bacterium]
MVVSPPEVVSFVRSFKGLRVAPSSYSTVAILAVFALATWWSAGTPRESAPVEAHDFADALECARANGRLVALDFTSEEAPCSARFREDTLCDPAVRATLADGFVHLELDALRERELFRACFGRDGFLASCVLDADGDVLAEHAGWSAAAEHVERLERARDGACRVDAARELVSLANDDGAAWLLLGEAREACGNPRLAEQAFLRALELAPKDATVAASSCERLARFAAERGDGVTARESLARLHEIGATGLEARAHVTEGLLREIERTPRLAAGALELALESLAEPAERSTALLALARAQRDCGDERAAVATLARLLDHGFDSITRSRARDSLVALQRDAHGHDH